MYQVELTRSLFPAQADAPCRELTVADMLAEQRRVRGDHEALTA